MQQALLIISRSSINFWFGMVDVSGDVMGKKNHKKAIRSLNKRIAEHQEKIRLEYEKESPDDGLIRHWEMEIRAFEKGIRQALKRLGK